MNKFDKLLEELEKKIRKLTYSYRRFSRNTISENEIDKDIQDITLFIERTNLNLKISELLKSIQSQLMSEEEIQEKRSDFLSEESKLLSENIKSPFLRKFVLDSILIKNVFSYTNLQINNSDELNNQFIFSHEQLKKRIVKSRKIKPKRKKDKEKKLLLRGIMFFISGVIIIGLNTTIQGALEKFSGSLGAGLCVLGIDKLTTRRKS